MALLGAAMVVYDFQLDAAYRKGDYTKPFYDYVKLGLTGFDRIDLNSSTAIPILLVRGDFKVLASPDIRDYLVIHQEGTRLIIDARFLDHFRASFRPSVVYISCPALKAFTADSRYYIGDKVKTDSAVHAPWYQATTLSGFRLDSLTLTAQNAAKLMLKNDTVRKLTAAVGLGVDLTLGEGNQFSGDLEVMNGARLFIGAAAIGNLRYHLADSAELDINGAAAKQLMKINQP
jgi:hypothetical protein